MKIGWFSVWTSAAEAKAYGCTHHATLFGCLPGFIGEVAGVPLWVPRSDVISLIEDVVTRLAVLIQQTQGDEPSFMFRVGREIEL